MAITRGQHSLISLAQSRRLRSRAVPYGQPPKRPLVRRAHQNGNKSARLLPLLVHADHQDGRTEPQQSRDDESSEGSNLDSGSRWLECEGPAGCDELVTPQAEGRDISAGVDNEEGSTSLQNNLTSPRPFLPSAVSTYNTLHQASLQLSSTPGIAIETALPSSINPQDVGVPNDGKWDVIAAHEARFCFQHGEDEWLLECENKWMDPSDFDIPGAEAELEAKLQKYKSNPWDLNRYHLHRQAECDGNLWSQVDTPIQKRELGDRVIYLIRWKLCWTLQSYIDDMSWVRSSFKAQNDRIKRRRSSRLEEMAPKRAAGREAVMVVVNLDDWL